jgi:hypothetical protein
MYLLTVLSLAPIAKAISFGEAAVACRVFDSGVDQFHFAFIECRRAAAEFALGSGCIETGVD